MKPGPRVCLEDHLHCNLATPVKNLKKKKKHKKKTTTTKKKPQKQMIYIYSYYSLTMFCIFLGREFEEEFEDFCYKNSW